MLTRPLIPLAKVDDRRLVARAGAGDAAAFTALYDRHHPALLAFCRHMLGNRHDGEDALQQTFIRAHQAMLRGQRPDEPRAWLFAIARNRCRTMLASRRDTVADSEQQLEGVSVDGLGAEAQQRAELRDLLADMSKLPEDQRAALLLTELRGFTHEQIAHVIGCPAQKVKALVFQARTHLLAEREARDTACVEIRQRLEVARGGELRRGVLRRHLRRCDPCRAYSVAVAGQRSDIAGLMVVLPSAGLKLSVLGAVGLAGSGVGDGAAGGAAAAAGVAAGSGGTTGVGGVSAGTAGVVATKVAAVKVAAVLAVGGMAAGGAAATVDRVGQGADRADVARSATSATTARAAAGAGQTPVAQTAAVVAGSPRAGRAARRGARGARARARLRRGALRRARTRRAAARRARLAGGARPATRTGGARRAPARRRRGDPEPAGKLPGGAGHRHVGAGYRHERAGRGHERAGHGHERAGHRYERVGHERAGRGHEGAGRGHAGAGRRYEGAGRGLAGAGRGHERAGRRYEGAGRGHEGAGRGHAGAWHRRPTRSQAPATPARHPGPVEARRPRCGIVHSADSDRARLARWRSPGAASRGLVAYSAISAENSTPPLGARQRPERTIAELFSEG